MSQKVSNPISRSLQRCLRTYVWLTATMCFAVGGTVLWGWAIDNHLMKALLPTLVEMKPNTALGFMLCGIGLAFRHGDFGKKAANVASVLAALLCLLGGATLFEYVTQIDLGIDRLMFTERLRAFGTSAPGRMALTSAIAHLAAGLSLLLVDHPAVFARRFGQYCAVIIAGCGLATTLGYAYGLRDFSGVASYTQMALHAAITFSVLSPALLALRPSFGFVPTFLGQRNGSQMARPLVLAAVLIPTVLGRVVLWGQRLHYFDPEFGFSAHVILNVICFVGLAAILAHALNQTNGARERAEEDLRSAHNDLEARVSQRTLDLAAANEALKSEMQERNRAAVALGHSETKFRSLIESANAAIVIANSAGEILSWNGGAQRIFGYEPVEVIGRPLSTLIPSQMQAAHNEGLRRVAAGGPTELVGQVAEVPGVHKDGRTVPLELSLTTWQQDGERFFSGTMTDITIRKQAQAAMAAAREQAETANRAKSEFLANMSHEIRTPLNGIIGMTELTLDTQLDGQQRENLETVGSSAESLLEIVNDILDFSKIEAGKFLLEEIAFDPRQVVNNAVRVLSVRATEKGLRLESKIAPEVPLALIGDPLRLRQVLLNLVGNAIKFTKAGEVCVRVSGRRHGDSLVHMQISVSDTGVGIPAEKQDAIFAAFSQADTSTTRRFGGTGLGLAISSRLVELMGGKLEVKSEWGVGSTFEFGVDLAVAVVAPGPDDEVVIAKKPMPFSVGRRVLLVEDNPVNQRVATGMLAAAGHTVIVAGNGEVALEQLKAHQFDVVLMDIQMPVMDGFTATRQWRANETAKMADGVSGLTSRVPIIAMTAHALTGDEERCREAGMDDYLTKPVRRRALLAKLENWGACHVGARMVTVANHRPSATGDSSEQEEVMDRQAFLDEMDHDAELVGDLVELFQSDSVRQLAVIREALVANDALVVSAAAHSLKGAIGHFRASRAFQAAAALEDLAAQGNLTDADDGFARLSREVALLTAALPALTENLHQ